MLSSANGHTGGLCAGLCCSPSGSKDLCSPKEGPNHPCEREVYQGTKDVDLAGPLTQPEHTEHTGLIVLLLAGLCGATCQASAADKK